MGRYLARLKRLFLGPDEVRKRRICGFLKEHKQGLLNGPGRPSMPKTLAVVVPCFGHSSYLSLAFTSIIKQTRLPDEVIFVNDCSPDGTSNVLKTLVGMHAAKSPVRFKIVNNELNVGQSESINIGVRASCCDLIMVLNDDDYLFHDAVEVILWVFEKYKDVYLVGAQSVHFEDDQVLISHEKFVRNLASYGQIPITIQYPYNVPKYTRLNDLNMTHSGSTFFKVAWQSVGGYLTDKRDRTVLPSDRDFQLRVNALYPVAVSYAVPFSFWRDNSSVDEGIFS
jgi:GT2 family glycosyltransferase